VEDNQLNQTIAKHMLTRPQDGWRCEVDIADNGAEAVKAYMKKKYDLLLMDCNMPGGLLSLLCGVAFSHLLVMDGFAATRLIRGYEQREGMKEGVVIVAVTASAMEEDRYKCFEAGMDDVLTKPFRADAIRNIVLKWMKRVSA
jgi:CheY-like chemotaxis protein